MVSTIPAQAKQDAWQFFAQHVKEFQGVNLLDLERMSKEAASTWQRSQSVQTTIITKQQKHLYCNTWFEEYRRAAADWWRRRYQETVGWCPEHRGLGLDIPWQWVFTHTKKGEPWSEEEIAAVEGILRQKLQPGDKENWCQCWSLEKAPPTQPESVAQYTTRRSDWDRGVTWAFHSLGELETFFSMTLPSTTLTTLETRLLRFLQEIYGDLPPSTRIEMEMESLSGGAYGTPHQEVTAIRVYTGAAQVLPDFDALPYWREILTAYPYLFADSPTHQQRLDTVQELLTEERVYLEYGLDRPDTTSGGPEYSITLEELQQKAQTQTEA